LRSSILTRSLRVLLLLITWITLLLLLITRIALIGLMLIGTIRIAARISEGVVADLAQSGWIVSDGPTQASDQLRDLFRRDQPFETSRTSAAPGALDGFLHLRRQVSGLPLFIALAAALTSPSWYHHAQILPKVSF
jgi:hypothetical protein